MTVAIPVLDGMGHLPHLMREIRGQDWTGSLEILVFDSESTDGSWEWLQGQSDIVAKQIPRSSFSHGGTRQAMAEAATQPVIAFLTQDAVPASRFWLQEIVRPLDISEQVAAVVGRQTPRPEAPAVVKRDIVVSFANLGNPLGISLYVNGPTVDEVFGRQPLAFISDVNAAYRRDVLTGVVPFPQVDYAEDQAIARRLLDAGYAIAYSPFAEVIHSNDLNLGNFRDRIEDETRGLEQWLGVAAPTERVWGRGMLKASAKGVVFALRDSSVPRVQRWQAAAEAPRFEIRRRQAWRSVGATDVGE